MKVDGSRVLNGTKIAMRSYWRRKMTLTQTRQCGCEVTLKGTGGLSTVTAGNITKKCEKHENMSDAEIRAEPYKRFNEILRKYAGRENE
jgi:hypothetical protein